MGTIVNEIEALLPLVRRFARAVTGDRLAGDQLAERALRTLLESNISAKGRFNTKLALFQILVDQRDTDNSQYPGKLSPAEKRAFRLLARLTPGSREALLLRAFGGFTDDEIAIVLRMDTSNVSGLIQTARQEIALALTGRVLIIEDELSVADDIEQIVSRMGHSVIGAAPTRSSALRMIQNDPPDLILSDIQLADGGDGIETVSEIQTTHQKVPAIFITGFPERLLTGKDREPAFLITKPYSEEQVRSAVSQAMFFAERHL